ncbi:MAG TPA: GGDEF domain-containing protein [Limnochordia bacterium]|nr:GGDEF domain-containing protein [Limnochordia bacterium]
MPTRMNGFWGMLIGLAGVCVLFVVEKIFGIRSISHLYVLLILVNGIGGYIFGTLYKRIRELSVLDSLTHVYNRNFFFPQFEKQISLAKRHGYPVTLVIFDLDRFKEHNDAYGHLHGDSLLKEVASILKCNIRESDTLARFGGDEFVLLLPYTSDHEASKLVQRLKQRLAECLPENPVSLSAGIAMYPQDGATTRELLQRADIALYQAKQKRDTIRLYREVAPTLAERPLPS